MLLWVFTGIIMLGLEAFSGYLNYWALSKDIVPNIDLILVTTIGLFAKKERMFGLLILLSFAKASLSSFPLSCTFSAFVFTGFLMLAVRKMFFRNTFFSRFVFSFIGISCASFILYISNYIGRSCIFPDFSGFFLPVLTSAFAAVFIIPVFCVIPPFSFHMEKGSV